MAKRSIDISAAFNQRRADALTRWRTAVADHAGGKKVDLGELIDCAALVGVAPTAVATAFAGDVAAYELAQQQAATVAVEEKLFREAQRAAPSPAEVQAAREKLDELLRRETAQRWTAEGLAHASGDAQRHRRAHPRLWDDLAQDDAAAAQAALELPPEMPEPAPVPVAAGIGHGEADFLPDDD